MISLAAPLLALSWFAAVPAPPAVPVAGDAPSATPPLRFGVIPAIAKERTSAELTPITRYLGEQLGRPVELVIAQDYADIIGRLVRREVDFALLFPLAYVQAEAEAPDLSLLGCSIRQGKGAYRGYVVTRRESAVHTLADLRGKRFAFVDRNSTSGYLYPVQLFLHDGLIHSERELRGFFSEVQFRKSHDGVLAAVLGGEADAGAVYDGELAQAAKIGVDSGELRILARTEPIPHEAVVAAPGVPSQLRDAFASALLSLDTRTAKGRAVLRPLVSELKFNGFCTCDRDRFAAIRALVGGKR